MTFIEQFYSGYKVMESPQFFFVFLMFFFLKRFPYTLHLILVSDNGENIIVSVVNLHLCMTRI